MKFIKNLEVKPAYDMLVSQ